ncbi:apyrase KNAG_0L00790 [Huiozyma naganishii CBS 8797]|uniref:Golgi apyrase n=1 Tax=Huiozyma naganishii (strain ATCC MYA-139 / BCRC 22969 / CBS 8797 / KCTC 17520 / NBRC 10181 / NCYC 3082 / Yp74L-3) TaxID=1071383 RepID=J7RCV0_HUIN7|nr:hypothetical protein KNAG_0L00790 [Kazachstania naganishii CBS 8797]CCK72700.1 hypothetical protein KNAG_0L00790 [Kazachstania naganishii CBS 8797]
MIAPENDDYEYGVVIDAGSSGSRIHVYRWVNPLSSTISEDQLHSVPAIEQSKDWTSKTNPGLSSFEDKPNKAFSHHIKPLLKFAQDIIPKNKIENTPIFIQATAGMRLLKEKKRKLILKNLCDGIKKSTKFFINDCDSQIEVIDGETEGLYGWLSLNYLADHFNNYHRSSSNHFTFGFMDMGGASAQIAFVPSNEEEVEKHREDIATVYLKSVNGDVQEWDIFVSTWLGFGANQARQRYWAQLVNALPENTNSYDDDDFSTRKLYDPCMPKGSKHEFKFKKMSFTAIGLGDFDQCTKSIYPLLLKNIPCKDKPCLFNGVHTPRIDFSKDKFVGVSEYWYVPNDIFKLGGAYDFEKFSENVKNFCNSDWKDLLENNKKGAYNSIPDDFLIDSCFKSNWILNVLHEGFEMPKSIGEAVPEEDHPTFQSLDRINDTELSWTLGRILLYASGQVVLGDKNVRVGVVPSKIEAKEFGKTFISGTVDPYGSSNSGIFGLSFKLLIPLFIIGTVVFHLSKSNKSKWRNLHISRFAAAIESFIRYVKRWRDSTTTVFEMLSEVEEGRFDRPSSEGGNSFRQPTSYPSRSKSMFDFNGHREGRPSTGESSAKRAHSERAGATRPVRGIKPAFSMADFNKLQDRGSHSGL